MHSRAMFVLLTLRLLMPPGICVCHLADTASRAAPAPETGEVALPPDPLPPAPEPVPLHVVYCVFLI
jgi:hypothetical protein